MRHLSFQAGLLVCAALPAFCQKSGANAPTAAEPPKSWIDPDTGHRVVRLTDEPGSASLYFNQNGYTSDGKDLIYTTASGRRLLDTGLAYDSQRDILYVASTADNAIFGISDAGDRTTPADMGFRVFDDQNRLHGPLGLVLAPQHELISSSQLASSAQPCTAAVRSSSP